MKKLFSSCAAFLAALLMHTAAFAQTPKPCDNADHVNCTYNPQANPWSQEAWIQNGSQASTQSYSQPSQPPSSGPMSASGFCGLSATGQPTESQKAEYRDMRSACNGGDASACNYLRSNCVE